MKRRKFIAASAIASAIPLSQLSGKDINYSEQIKSKEIYELRTYEIKFRGNQNLLRAYLNDVLRPALKKIGVNHFITFSEYSKEDPAKIWVLISYPDSDIYINAQGIISNPEFIAKAAEYNALPPDKPIYNRYKSSLLLAFDGMTMMDGEIKGSNLFELRIYEGYSEDAVRRKIKMFNVEEIALFHETNLPPVFFGEMISGPYRPCLVYMLKFKDMEERNANWSVFGNHPEWNKMRVKEEYANTVSNIRKIFLTPI